MLGRTSNLVLGIGVLLTGATLVAIIFVLPDPPKVGRGLATTIILIPTVNMFLAFVWEESRPITLRVIGAGFFFLFAVGIGKQLLESPFATSEWVEGIGKIALVGMPCGILMVTGSYPRWGKWGSHFNNERR